MITKIFVPVVLMCSISALAHANGKAEATEVCNSISSSFTRTDCLALVSKAEFFTPDAMKRICLGISSSFTKKDCVEAAIDKPLRVEDVNECASPSSDFGKVECLQGKPRGSMPVPAPAPAPAPVPVPVPMPDPNSRQVQIEGCIGRLRDAGCYLNEGILYSIRNNVRSCLHLEGTPYQGVASEIFIVDRYDGSKKLIQLLTGGHQISVGGGSDWKSNYCPAFRRDGIDSLIAIDNYRAQALSSAERRSYIIDVTGVLSLVDPTGRNWPRPVPMTKVEPSYTAFSTQ